MKIEPREITKELKESYLDYAMSVIVSRALPDVRDGLKPVQRRILWAMWDGGITSGAKPRKSAYVVGETMGKYHPHGDMAIYDALARMAQDFSLRYQLIQGTGNWGSIEGDSPAAQRYTECKLSKIAEELLTDIEKETVDWQPNYDATREEPKYLPAKLPNMLLNGASGIAVGMATNIPPHNLGEVVDATLHLIDNPKAETSALLDFIKGPDFPTGGVIYDRQAIAQAYSTGRGRIVSRGTAEIKDNLIEITSIPYQVNAADLVVKIAELVTEKKIEGIRDVRNEIGKEGVRIVIEIKNDAAPQKVLNYLYEHTDLQKDFHLNMLALVEGLQPELLSLKDVLGHYLEHRQRVVRRRAEFELRRAKEREHILLGLARALSIIDEVIRTIKRAADREDAFKKLIKNFEFSEIQANAILEMRLQTLAALERQKIEDELKAKQKLIAELQILLKSPAKILKVIKDELLEIKEKYGDQRKTRVFSSSVKEFKEEDLIPEEEVIITFSHGGNIKRVPPTNFRSQHRGGKGLIGSEVAEEDFLDAFLAANTHDNILFFTDRGRVFQTKVWEIPVGTRTSKGKAVHNFLEIPLTEKISAIVAYVPAEASGDYLVMLTEGGIIKKTSLSDLQNVRRTGIIAINLRKNDLLRWVQLSSGSDEIIITTKDGQSIRFKESQVRPMGRTASGVQAIRLKKDDLVSSLNVVSKNQKNTRLLVVTENGYGKQTPLVQYRIQKRGGSGIKTVQVTRKTGRLMSAHVIDEEEEIFVLSSKGQVIRTKIAQIRVAGRATQGVKVMTLEPGDKIVGAICL